MSFHLLCKYIFTLRSILMKVYTRYEFLNIFKEINYSREWTDKISKQRQGPAGIQGHI